MPHPLFYPPVAFVIIMVFIMCISALLSRLAFRPWKQPQEGSSKAYACGEDIPEHRVQIDYGQFFSFAFFFTILHVLTLVIATVPIETTDSFFISVIYIAGAITGLFVLFRKDRLWG